MDRSNVCVCECVSLPSRSQTRLVAGRWEQHPLGQGIVGLVVRYRCWCAADLSMATLADVSTHLGTPFLQGPSLLCCSCP